MDLIAYVTAETPDVSLYVQRHYGPIPRMRGALLMEAVPPGNGYLHEGEPVVYIHTRCGGGNYDYFGAGEWECGNPLFIEGTDDEFDCTYRDSYFRAVVDDEYRAILASLESEAGE